MKDKNRSQHIVSIPTDIGPHQLTAPGTNMQNNHTQGDASGYGERKK